MKIRYLLYLMPALAHAGQPIWVNPTGGSTIFTPTTIARTQKPIYERVINIFTETCPPHDLTCQTKNEIKRQEFWAEYGQILGTITMLDSFVKASDQLHAAKSVFCTTLGGDGVDPATKLACSPKGFYELFSQNYFVPPFLAVCPGSLYFLCDAMPSGSCYTSGPSDLSFLGSSAQQNLGGAPTWFTIIDNIYNKKYTITTSDNLRNQPDGIVLSQFYTMFQNYPNLFFEQVMTPYFLTVGQGTQILNDPMAVWGSGENIQLMVVNSLKNMQYFAALTQNQKDLGDIYWENTFSNSLRKNLPNGFQVCFGPSEAHLGASSYDWPFSEYWVAGTSYGFSLGTYTNTSLLGRYMVPIDTTVVEGSMPTVSNFYQNMYKTPDTQFFSKWVWTDILFGGGDSPQTTGLYPLLLKQNNTTAVPTPSGGTININAAFNTTQSCCIPCDPTGTSQTQPTCTATGESLSPKGAGFLCDIFTELAAIADANRAMYQNLLDVHTRTFALCGGTTGQDRCANPLMPATLAEGYQNDLANLLLSQCTPDEKTAMKTCGAEIAPAIESCITSKDCSSKNDTSAGCVTCVTNTAKVACTADLQKSLTSCIDRAYTSDGFRENYQAIANALTNMSLARCRYSEMLRIYSLNQLEQICDSAADVTNTQYFQQECYAFCPDKNGTTDPNNPPIYYYKLTKWTDDLQKKYSDELNKLQNYAQAIFNSCQDPQTGLDIFMGIMNWVGMIMGIGFGIMSLMTGDIVMFAITMAMTFMQIPQSIVGAETTAAVLKSMYLGQEYQFAGGGGQS